MNLFKKYKPKSIDDFFISKNYKARIREYINLNKNKPQNDPIIIYGNRGVGKTSLAEVVLKNLGVNNIIILYKDNIDTPLQKHSLLGENGYIIENIDEYNEKKQLEIYKRIKTSGVKAVMTAIDLYKVHYRIRKESFTFNLYNPNPNLLKKFVYQVIRDYNLEVPKYVIDRIVSTHPHDIRALLSDLQVLINLKDYRLFLKNYNVRNYKYNLLSVLDSFFNSSSYTEAIKSYMSSTEDYAVLSTHILDNVINSKGAIHHKAVAMRVIGQAMLWRLMGYFNNMKTWGLSITSLMIVPELYRSEKLKIIKIRTSPTVFEYNKNQSRITLISKLVEKVKKKYPYYSYNEAIELLELYGLMLNDGKRIRSELEREFSFTKEEVDKIQEIFT